MSDAHADTDQRGDSPGDDEVTLDIPSVRFDFAEENPIGVLARLFGVHRRSSFVEISGLTFRARFGPWVVETPISNIESAEITGPYRWYRVAGPARWSPDDHGITFATTTRRGVQVSFREPVRGLDALGWMRHPNLTVTVDRPEELVAAIGRTEDEAELIERDEQDQLQGKTTHELRELARQHGIERPSSLKKAELVAALRAVID